MFTSIGRRLALFNALVVVVVIAATGALTYGVLRHSLNAAAERGLTERVEQASTHWRVALARGLPIPPPVGLVDDGDGDGARDESREFLESGDAILFAFDRTGKPVVAPYGLRIDGLPALQDVAPALAKHPRMRLISLSNGVRARVYTAPVIVNKQVVGAVQAVRGQTQHEGRLRLVLLASIVGVGLGVLAAVPAGLFLAGRAMQPIDLAFERQRAFVADASHALRTPLTVVRANAELIQRLPAATPAETRAEIESIVTEIDGMSRLVDKLLLLARADAGRLVVNRELTALDELVRGAVAEMQPVADVAGLSLRCEVTCSISVLIDCERIREVVRILLDNAIAYTPPPGTIRVSVAQQGRRGLVRVADTGLGISSEEQRDVWRRFYRADRARARAGGSGLGLAIARAIIEAHGGEIHLQSTPGRGTVIWFGLARFDGNNAGAFSPPSVAQ